MSGRLLIANRQRTVRVDARLLKRLVTTLLEESFQLENFDLAINLVRAPEMARINQTFLQHEGSTDVITFDYSEPSNKSAGTHPLLHGEIFICIDDTLAQAREFGAPWQSELARYAIHGVLHLRGFDDLQPAARREMKREENRLLKEMERLFPLKKLGARPRLAP